MSVKDRLQEFRHKVVEGTASTAEALQLFVEGMGSKGMHPEDKTFFIEKIEKTVHPKDSEDSDTTTNQE